MGEEIDYELHVDAIDPRKGEWVPLREVT